MCEAVLGVRPEVTHLRNKVRTFTTAVSIKQGFLKHGLTDYNYWKKASSDEFAEMFPGNILNFSEED